MLKLALQKNLLISFPTIWKCYLQLALTHMSLKCLSIYVFYSLKIKYQVENMIRQLTKVNSNFRMIKPQWILSQHSKQCEIDVSNCWNELYRDTAWLPCSKCLPLYLILNQTNVWAIHFDKSCWFVENRESVWICLNYLFSYSASGNWFETL